MSSKDIDVILEGIISSLDETRGLVDGLSIKNKESPFSSLVEDLLQKLNQEKLEGVSLLALKNNSLLSYINNLVLIVLGHLKRVNGSCNDEVLEDAVKGSIVQRVTLEKGIKPLEKKLNYQLDKMIRSYHRMEAENKKQEEELDGKMRSRSSEGGNSSSANSSDVSSGEEEEDELSLKPDSSALAKLTKEEKSNPITGKEKYRPPKISAVAPPTQQFDTKRQHSGRKLQSMEEYLRDSSDLPQVETSIGSTIVDSGRGGVKTNAEREKEKEIQSYEENNFVRLPQTQMKKSFKDREREKVNNFAGEDWSMFNNNRKISDDTSRKRKSKSAWDRAKRKHT
ncbi:uncharacterized protein PRCAT00002634001 [Priceomyces carsonii]|uniref:uncharacterized protein n=1 Tax=Priceomyces carsonii TaxID=28549 RepID=UPI002ED795E3|nr:unnamed protein product [Priceomyces carsonii]